MRKYTFNYEFFNSISSVSAYWLGFLFADGCLSYRGKNPRLTINLSAKDLDHLKLFCNDIGLSLEAIKARKQTGFSSKYGSYVVELQHKCLIALEKFGIVPAKTYNFIQPDINLEFFGDFLRGYFDGNGSISIPKTIKNPKLSFCGNIGSMLFIKDTLVKLGLISKVKIQPDSKGSKLCFRYIISGTKQCSKVYKILKGSSYPRLNRKWEKLENYFENCGV